MAIFVLAPLFAAPLFIRRLQAQAANPGTPPPAESKVLQQRWELLILFALLAGMVATPFWLERRDGNPGARAADHQFDTPGYKQKLPVTAVALSPNGKALWGDLVGNVQLERRTEGERIHYTTVGTKRDEVLILRERVVNLLQKRIVNFRKMKNKQGAKELRTENEKLQTEIDRLRKEIARLEKEPEKKSADLRTDGGRVVSVAFSADSNRALAARHDGSLFVRDMRTGPKLRQLTGCGWIGCAAFAPDGCTIVTASAWPTFFKNRLLAEWIGWDAWPSALKPTAMTEPVDRVAHLWDTESGKQMGTFKGHRGPVRAVAFAPTGRQILTASDDGTMRLWDVVSGLEVRRLKRSSSRVLCVALSPDGERALSGHVDGSVRVWDLEEMEEIRSLERHRDGVSAVAFAPDGHTAFSGSLDKTVRRWDTTTGRQEGICRCDTVVYSLAVSQDGLTVLVGGAGGHVQRWGWPSAKGR
jgi:hypothetical protein